MKQVDPKLNLGCNLWVTPGCYLCGKPYEPDCWWIFVFIGNRQYQVPICNACDKERTENDTGEKAI